jgi:hypothetical protein
MPGKGRPCGSWLHFARQPRKHGHNQWKYIRTSMGSWYTSIRLHSWFFPRPVLGRWWTAR